MVAEASAELAAGADTKSGVSPVAWCEHAGEKEQEGEDSVKHGRYSTDLWEYDTIHTQ